MALGICHQHVQPLKHVPRARKPVRSGLSSKFVATGPYLGFSIDV